MLIIIEGMDKTGKSTLASYLLKALPDAYYLKSGFKPKDSSDKEKEKITKIYEKVYLTYTAVFSFDNLIVDRFYASELVYGKIKRGYDVSKDDFFIALKDRLESNEEVVFIYCKTDKERIKRNFVKDKEDFAKLTEIDKLYDEYEKVFKDFDGKVIIYDYAKQMPEDILEELKNAKL